MKYTHTFTRLLLLTLFSAPTMAELRTNAEPLTLRNTNPFIQIFGLPPMESGSIMTKGENKFQFIFDAANNTVSSKKGDDRIDIKGESYRSALIWKRGLIANIEVGAEIPYIAHRGGLRDNTDTPTYTFYRGDEKIVGFTTNNSGIGDLRVFAAKGILNSPARKLKARVSFDLPTGDDRKLHSSGDVNFAISLAGTENELLMQWDTTLFAHTGLLMIGQNPGDGPAVKKVRREVSFFGGISLNRKYTDYFDAKIQFEGHTPMYRSPLRQLGKASLLLTIGGAFYIDQSTTLDFSLGSSLFTSVAPDIPFNVALSYHF